MQESSTKGTHHPSVWQFRQDFETQLRQQVREAIETVLEAGALRQSVFSTELGTHPCQPINCHFTYGTPRPRGAEDCAMWKSNRRLFHEDELRLLQPVRRYLCPACPFLEGGPLLLDLL